MNDDYGRLAEGDARALQFTGSWREYLPIAASNALLTIVTLGIYRFWATARERRYLWSRTDFIDDNLEWTGTGKEMFIGFLIVAAFLIPFFLVVQFVFPALVARGMEAAAATLLGIFYLGLIYLGGVARFRALRYRLSRTRWHGIRGGSDDPGLRYGAEYLGRYLLAAVTLMIMFPWALTRLWNKRWAAMSFGPLQFSADLRAGNIAGRWAAIYLAPLLGVLVISVFGIGLAAAVQEGSGAGALAVVLIAIFLIFYVALPLLTLAFFAKFYREAAASTRLGDLGFEFDAKTVQWLKLYLGNFALAIVTLGFGIFFWGYRNWSFLVRHTQVTGTVDLETLTQSSTTAPGEAEGFADMFDVGAF